MNEAPPSSRLQRCIRDLVALNALPSMCVGRSPEEAVEILMDALPTALNCDLVHLTVPGAQARASFRGARVVGSELLDLTAALQREPDVSAVLVLDRPTRMWCLAAELTLQTGRGKLVVGKSAPLDVDTDHVLIRAAANLAGATLETANVLEAAKRKDEFLAVLGHELRNPLAPIVTAIELLTLHPEVTRVRQVLERNTRHLVRLVDDLLDISRVTRGHVELRREPVALDAILERAVELASPLVERHHHTLVVGTAQGAVLEGDPVRLAQVFGNILTNAAKFTPPGGRIEVSVDVDGGFARVKIRDDGRGIPRDKLAQIFDAFMQIDRTTDAARGGLGLGLAIVKDLVDRHGGRITAESDGPGTGATFTIELPLTTRAIERAEPSLAHESESESRRGVRVLIVDDNVDVATLLAEALRAQGFETAVAYDAHDAMERWAHFDPHAAILDVGLPDISGYDLARAFRTEHGEAPLLIAATGYGQATDRDAAESAGFDCHFVKPVNVQDIVRAIDDRKPLMPRV